MTKTLVLFLFVLSLGYSQPLMKDTGYRGIWYFNQASPEPYRFKYSGGLGTYSQAHVPMAVYSKEADKTFFCWGGTPLGRNHLLMMISYYDHKTGLVPRPRILLDKETDDAHDAPTLTIDDQGYLWVFSSAHGIARPAYIHRSKEPYSIDEFTPVKKQNFSYMQPWFIPGEGFLLLHTLYSPGRNLFTVSSRDGANWGEPKPVARIGEGHYGVTWRHEKTLGLAFNYHPEGKGKGLNFRTNLYYLETSDSGKSWHTVDGAAVQTPLTEIVNPALVRNYEAEGLLVYMKNLVFDQQGRPVILFLTSRGWQPTAENGPHQWNTAQWDGRKWDIRPVTISDNNYDFGSLYIEPDGLWRIIAPTDPGPVVSATGGEVVMWTSQDRGRNWLKARLLTPGSARQHTYVRHPWNAHPDFYAFWADGDAMHLSESSLYFTNRNGDRVWRLPTLMKSEFARPEVAW